MSNQDLSDKAVLQRYSKANELAIVTSDRITFESLMDVFSLVQERKALKVEIEELKSQILTLESHRYTAGKSLGET